MRETRVLETEEQTAKRRKSNREHVRETRALETEEQTAKCRKSNREHVRETRVLETEEQTAKRRKSNRKRVVQRRSNVSVEAAIDLFITKTKQGPDKIMRQRGDSEFCELLCRIRTADYAKSLPVQDMYDRDMSLV